MGCCVSGFQFQVPGSTVFVLYFGFLGSSVDVGDVGLWRWDGEVHWLLMCTGVSARFQAALCPLRRSHNQQASGSTPSSTTWKNISDAL